MATVRIPVDLRGMFFLNATAPEYKQLGTNIPIPAFFFDAAADEAGFLRVPIIGYGSGNLSVIVRMYADTATTGNMVWGAAIHALTPADAQDIEADTLATETTTTIAASGTAQAMVEGTITVSNLDSLANLDFVTMRIRRVGSNGSDTMAGDAALVQVRVEFSDT